MTETNPMNYGRFVYRTRWYVLGVWLAAAAFMMIFVKPVDPTLNEPATFLPSRMESSQASAAITRYFPNNAGLSQAVVVFERPDGPLTAADRKAIEAVTSAIGKPSKNAIGEAKGITEEEIARLTIVSPQKAEIPAIPFVSVPVPNPLISADGKAGLILVNVPYNYVTANSAAIVNHIDLAIDRTPLPKGLKAAVTGSSGYGRDYARSAERSNRNTLYVTLAAVIIILLLVYRSPIAAVIPLLSISLAGIITSKLLAVFQPLGLHAGTAELIFVFVLLYGAGTDYSLLFISRYREFLDEQVGHEQAVSRGLSATMPAILASAGTNTSGLLMLVFAEFMIFRTTGPAVAIALVVALLAAITLTPAMVGIIGPGMFWPGRRTWHGHPIPAKPEDTERVTSETPIPQNAPRHRVRAQSGVGLGRALWARLALMVSRRPGAVTAVVVLALIVPAIEGMRLTWVYDTLAALPAAVENNVGNASEGMAMTRKHWPVGEVGPVSVLVESLKEMEPASQDIAAKKITQSLLAVKGVRDVRSLSQPLGSQYARELTGLVHGIIATKMRADYAGQGKALRFSVILDQPALTLQAMDTVRNIEAAAKQAATDANVPQAHIYVAGATAEMMDVRSVTGSDFQRIVALTLAVIFFIVLFLLWDPLLALFMVSSTVLSYLATLGITGWVFTILLGQAGLDWKVEVFLFVVMVAVGQDYNIFLAARLAQEGKHLRPRPATRRAIVFTGPVISSCGLIMAATLGSLMVGELGLLKQLGFAFALGMLIDTFVVRPLLLPAFAILTGRTGRAWASH